MMQKMFLPVAYDFYREGIDGPWKRSPNPCKAFEDAQVLP